MYLILDLLVMIIIHAWFLFTVPPPARNVRFSRINSSSINVTWEKQSLIELKGLANYIIEYNQVSSNRKKQLRNRVSVAWTEVHVVISNLIQSSKYTIFVQTSTSAGFSRKLSFID